MKSGYFQQRFPHFSSVLTFSKHAPASDASHHLHHHENTFKVPFAASITLLKAARVVLINHILCSCSEPTRDPSCSDQLWIPVSPPRSWLKERLKVLGHAAFPTCISNPFLLPDETTSPSGRSCFKWDGLICSRCLWN